ncbi:glutamate formimidoyltransferase [Clostridium cochlearium]|jgi:glutamate formiminotransferase|uniref:glutamate formimidoyltransferase n=1 Tax=Clostridium cochlearium TaxID=1494 RepID=A0A240AVB9_CLOCO|nr:glutamate formimidoyltransferase [Clostridium cochlearium]NSJ92133.1 glutamate formimidoyltransferase [Coprococcus sp. MSK.21.13]MBE6064800.1 glutamate formimidoyltransferase [Clostridium cochlearium]MBU5268254.1 glutamate formimidoyltransferase [Clostridium cochlearium]MCG4571812.1 glutamate formimidoyltransferase [Clostridium cochlearium]MCR1970899.1 glutamate formimidoyltransferase [Clostridium cochlearium]
MARLVECVPNFSEGKDKKIIETIVDEVRKIESVKLLDYSSDEDHNRSVVTMIGEPEDVKKAVLGLAKKAIELIDMTKHHGGHPRMGAVDVIPFTPVSDVTMDECVELANEVGKEIGSLGVPVYLYEDAATKPERQNLAKVRKGQYEGFFEKIKEAEWKPDYGPQEMNAKSGCTAVGARVSLVAFNVNLGTDNLEVADAIAKKIRFIGGGLRFVKAIGLKLEERNIVQVSMNLVNYEKTAVYRAFEMVKMEAKRYGVPVLGSEVIGTVPMKALLDCAEYYLQIEKFDISQILEKRLLD